MNSEIQQKLNELALKRSKPFCYTCYKEAPTGCCKTCCSDDLMRITENDGPEYGTEWVIENILASEITPVDLDKAFEDMICECYPETTKVGWLDMDTASILKEMDPISWRCAQSEWESQEAEEGSILSVP